MASQDQDLLKRLQRMQRLVERACAERDLAYAEAAQWKQRYETEAHQRQLERSQSSPVESEARAVDTEDFDVEAEKSTDEVLSLKQELEQLRLDLEKEKEEHQRTRASLITALGDALQRKST